MWKIVIGSNLNLQLKLLFYPLIITNNNLPFKICYEKVLIILWTKHLSLKLPQILRYKIKF